MTTFKQALIELEDNGVAVYHHGTPISSGYYTINGQNFSHNKFRDSLMRSELRNAIKEAYDILKKKNDDNVVSNQKPGAMLQQEFDAWGLPSLRPYLNYLIDNGVAEHKLVKWGKGQRWVVIIGGKTINIRADMVLINPSKIKL